MKNDAIFSLLQENSQSSWDKIDALNDEIRREGQKCGKDILLTYLCHVLPTDKPSTAWKIVLDEWVQDVLDGKELGKYEALDRLDLIDWI